MPKDPIFKKVQKFLQEDPDAVLRAVLETPFWPPGVKTDTVYTRQHDDTDGEKDGLLTITFSCDGDAWINIDTLMMLRFRTFGGGGASPRTRAAITVLAKAIQDDNTKPRL
jgi:hypothetical protein